MQTVIACVITAVVALIIGIPIGIQIRKRTAEKEINSAEEEAKRIINESIKSAESKKREALVEAKEEILQARNEYEREVKERRADLQKQERRLQQKEENLDRKTENIEKKEDTLQRKLAELDEARDEVATVKKTQMEVLERISGFTAEEAKNYLINQLAEEVTHESAMKVREIEAQFKEEADTRAKEILSLAIQRCAADHVAEATVSVVPLPNDEMKGRIIGREGRNIRTLETMTGVDLIIDDTPEAITVSCFDPVRREIARIALEKLIQDGRIHPTRIEEMVEKAKREVDATIKAEGERAVFETNVHGLHPELIKLLGRMRYRTSYGQNVLNHSIEVSLHRLLNQMGIHKNDLLILEGFTVIVGIRVHDRSPIYVVWGYYTPPIGFCLWRKRGEPPWRVSLPVNAFAKRFGGKAHVKGCSARWGRSPAGRVCDLGQLDHPVQRVISGCIRPGLHLPRPVGAQNVENQRLHLDSRNLPLWLLQQPELRPVLLRRAGEDPVSLVAVARLIGDPRGGHVPDRTAPIAVARLVDEPYRRHRLDTARLILRIEHGHP